MGWEKRERGRLYYTRSRWEDGHVVRDYFGCGQAAEAIAQLDAHARAMHLWMAARKRAEQARLEALDVQLDNYHRKVDRLMRSTLIALGFYQHRGEWRRRRGGGGGSVTKSRANRAWRAKSGDGAAVHANQPRWPDWRDADALERQQLLEAAQQGDPRAIDVVMAGIEEDADLRDQLTNSPRQEREALITTAIGARNVLMRASLLEQVKHREDALMAEAEHVAGTSPLVLEQLLIERVATSWLAAHLAAMEMEGRLRQSDASLSVVLAEFYERRRDRAHARYLSASLALAKVRRLLRPRRRGAQIHIAAQDEQQPKRRRDGD
jgi:hypothetical protein